MQPAAKGEKGAATPLPKTHLSPLKRTCGTWVMQASLRWHVRWTCSLCAPHGGKNGQRKTKSKHARTIQRPSDNFKHQARREKQRLISHMKNKEGEIEASRKEIADTLARFYEELYNADTTKTVQGPASEERTEKPTTQKAQKNKPTSFHRRANMLHSHVQQSQDPEFQR